MSIAKNSDTAAIETMAIDNAPPNRSVARCRRPRVGGSSPPAFRSSFLLAARSLKRTAVDAKAIKTTPAEMKAVSFVANIRAHAVAASIR